MTMSFDCQRHQYYPTPAVPCPTCACVQQRDRYKAALEAIATGCYDPVAVEWARKALEGK